ncbi:hypothetical protein KO498_16085 [Lentibacter algarum]|uniref:PaaX family transcriptional regulator C-terminal domain-containing protein n=1 Tax=Lentibacter algarum TaxID=576131 RepID=UPI001C084D99|nr:PaaX family transcriptional regulator C-terminal domain-containing protein [Lentibacter algarum]MBU2983326.1 hypothetical protein [Lentibacter algarum]
MTSSSPEFEAAFARLQRLAPLKTWSLIVTLLGDLEPQAKQALSSQKMQQICAPFGVKPEAFRVALHRLRKDGWLMVERQGRGSVYKLSEAGVTATQSAYEQVYRGACEAPSVWRLALVEAAEVSGLRVGDNLMILPDNTEAPEGALIVETPFAQVPDWMKTALVSDAEAAEFAGLEEALSFDHMPQNSLQRYSLRVLVLHHWRRIVLRHDSAVEQMLGEDWAGYKARKRVSELFEALERPENKAFEAA